jgi:sn-glycerol 3-phosphate transport system substrate-binding protein
VLADKFNAEHEGEYAITAISQGDIQELNQKVRAAAAGGGMPAALMGDDYDITQYTANGIIVDIEPYVANPETGFTQEQIDAFLPEQIDRHKLDIYDGRRMAMPQAFSAFTTWWNVEALDKAGFDGPPATWQEFPDFAREVSAANDGMVVWAESAPGDRFISLMKTHGVEWLKEDNTTANFDAPEALEIMTWWKELYDEGLFQILDDAQAAFVAGQSTFFLGSSASVRGMEDISTFTYDAGLPPQGANATEKRTETYGPVNCLPATSEEMQQAGWQWLKWLTTPAALATWIPATSYFPSVPSAADDPALDAFYTEFPVARKLLDEVAPYASILAPHPALTEVRGQITANNVNEVLLGRLSPEEGVQKLQAEANEAIARAVGEG